MQLLINYQGFNKGSEIIVTSLVEKLNCNSKVTFEHLPEPNTIMRVRKLTITMATNICLVLCHLITINEIVITAD